MRPHTKTDFLPTPYNYKTLYTTFMSDDEFQELVDQAVSSIPEEFKEALKDIAIIIQDEPDEEQRDSVHLLSHMSLFGLYQGVPLTKRASTLLTFPDKITIFKNPILRAHRSEEGIISQVRSTVLHEIGHYLGLSEEELRRRNA